MSTKTPAIHVFVGPMFAGKTTRLLQLHQIALQALDVRDERVLVIKFARDTRYSDSAVVSHDHGNGGGGGVPAIAVQRLDECEHTMDSAKRYFIFIDEGQFFEDLENTVLHWAAAGHSVAIAALDLDSERRPWEPVEALLKHATCKNDTMSVVRLCSTCTSCQRANSAAYTRRLVDDGDRVCIGGKELYQPCCEQCWPRFHVTATAPPPRSIVTAQQEVAAAAGL